MEKYQQRMLIHFKHLLGTIYTNIHAMIPIYYYHKDDTLDKINKWYSFLTFFYNFALIAGESAATYNTGHCDKLVNLYPHVCNYRNCHNACAARYCNGPHTCQGRYKCCCTCTGTHPPHRG